MDELKMLPQHGIGGYMDRWTTERCVRNGRTEFHFVWGGDLDEFEDLKLFIQQEFGATIKGRIDGPCGTTILDVGLADHDITLVFDSGYEIIFFFPVNEHDVEVTQAFANELQKKLNQRLGTRGRKE